MASSERQISFAGKASSSGVFDCGRTSMWWRAGLVLTSAAMFAACLTQTAFVTACCDVEGDTRSFYGLEMLFTGWGGVLGSPLHPLLFTFIIAGWVCACAKWHFAALIWAFSAIGVMAISPEFPNAGYAAWLANPIILTTWFFYLGDKRSAALISAIIALGLTLTFRWVVDVPLSDKLGDVKIVSYGSGYWLWIASAGILVAGVSANMFLRHIASGRR